MQREFVRSLIRLYGVSADDGGSVQRAIHELRYLKLFFRNAKSKDETDDKRNIDRALRRRMPTCVITISCP